MKYESYECEEVRFGTTGGSKEFKRLKWSKQNKIVRCSFSLEYQCSGSTNSSSLHTSVLKFYFWVSKIIQTASFWLRFYFSSYSNPGQVSLRAVRACSSDAASNARHIRWGTPAAASVRPSGTGTCLCAFTDDAGSYEVVVDNMGSLQWDMFDHYITWQTFDI